MVTVEDDVCAVRNGNGTGLKPAPVEACGSDVCPVYSWVVTTDWSNCSAVCGDNGYETRDVFCFSDDGIIRSQANDGECIRRVGQMPARRRRCTEDKAPVCVYEIGDWTNCTATCRVPGLESRTVACRRTIPSQGVNEIVPTRECLAAVAPAPQTLQPCSVSRELCECRNPFWLTGNWSTCSRSCGGDGIRYRSITCMCSVNALPPAPVAFQECNSRLGFDLQPAREEGCGSDICPCINYRWRSGGWEDCSVTCDQGIERRSVSCTCQRSGRREPVNDTALCNAFDVRPSTERICYQPECPCLDLRWEISEWSNCSVTCAGGLRYRSVRCMCGNSSADQQRCLDVGLARPPTEEECNTNECPCVNHQWQIRSRWTPCSKTCSNGTQSRVVECQCRVRGAYRTVSVGECIDLGVGVRPPDVRSCFTQCPCRSARYKTEGWRGCTSRVCDGVETRLVSCVCRREEDEEPADEYECTRLGLSRPIDRRTCSDPCTYTWSASAWSQVCRQRRFLVLFFYEFICSVPVTVVTVALSSALINREDA